MTNAKDKEQAREDEKAAIEWYEGAIDMGITRHISLSDAFLKGIAHGREVERERIWEELADCDWFTEEEQKLFKRVIFGGEG